MNPRFPFILPKMEYTSVTNRIHFLPFLKYISLCLIFLPLFCSVMDSFAQSPEDIKKQLIKKGVSQEVINLLNPRCRERLNSRLPSGVTWYATFDRSAKSVTVDFQTAAKAHETVTEVSLSNGGCMTIQNAVLVTVGSCQEEVGRWIESYKKRGVNMKIVEESQQRIYLGTEGHLGIKVFLYPLGDRCMQVFRNVETVK